MNADIDSLWRELRAILHARGELPLQHEVLTPGEIAAAIGRASGDPRVQRFVWEYYYPRCYGQIDGSLTDAEAAALIQSLRRTPAPPQPAAAAAPDMARCGICRRQPVDVSPPRKGGLAR